MKKGKSVKAGIVIALLLLVVGFAAVSTTLNFNGTVQVKGNATEFDQNLRFVGDDDEAKHATIVGSMPEKEGSTVTVSKNGKTLTFTTPILNTVDETATVSYWVENRGQYDAKFGTITCTAKADNETLLDYIEITPSTNYKDLVLAAGTTSNPTQTAEPATIAVKLKKTYASEEQANITVTCKLTAEAVEN